MENSTSAFTDFLLLGIVEMEGYEYLFGALVLIIYLFTMIFSVMIILVVFTEESLHEPMYILICNLVMNGIYGTTSIFPKLITDLFSSSELVSRTACFIQSHCVLTYGLFEISTFTIMAYDRYLAVCYPLQYYILMTYNKVLKLLSGSFILCFMSNLIIIFLSMILPLCGRHIKNIFCDNMAIVNLSCVDTSVNNLYGMTITVIFFAFTLLTIAYSYLQIFLLCLTLSRDSYWKAIHTLVTHLVSFSIFLVGAMFVFVRYRLNNVNTPLVLQIILSISPVVFSPIFNPLIYGIRTKALRTRVLHHLQRIRKWTNL